MIPFLLNISESPLLFVGGNIQRAVATVYNSAAEYWALRRRNQVQIPVLTPIIRVGYLQASLSPSASEEKHRTCQ